MDLIEKNLNFPEKPTITYDGWLIKADQFRPPGLLIHTNPDDPGQHVNRIYTLETLIQELGCSHVFAIPDQVAQQADQETPPNQFDLGSVNVLHFIAEHGRSGNVLHAVALRDPKDPKIFHLLDSNAFTSVTGIPDPCGDSAIAQIPLTFHR